MNIFFTDNLIWIILYPLWVFLLIGIGRLFAIRMSKKLITLITLAGSLLGIVFACGTLIHTFITGSSETVFTFIKIRQFLLQIGVSVDKLSAVYLLLLFTISFFIQLYSASYMKSEPKYYRFFGYLNLFNFAMGLLLVSPNLFQMYIGWELVGLVSYLLIGFQYTNPLKSVASIKTFIINRIGDTALLAGIACLMYIMYTYSIPKFVTLDFSDFNLVSSIAYAHTNNVTFFILCILLLSGAIVKSAQFPFHTWLQDAMNAPTPISALIHSATMVAAGVFLIIRLLPIFTLSKEILILIVILGMFTALFCSLCAICQDDVKSVLAYSTSANLGLMFAAVGFGNIDLAVIYLIVHGFIKAALFLSYGMANNEYSENGRTELPPTFIIGAFALAGLAFAGLNCKELFFDTFKENTFLSIELLLVTFMCAVYIFKLCCKYPLSKNVRPHPIEQISVWVFLIITTAGTFIINGSQLRAPFWTAFAGAITAILITIKAKDCTNGNLTQICKKGFFIDRFYTRCIYSLYGKAAEAANKIDLFISENKILYFIVNIFVQTAEWIEKNIFEAPVKLCVLCTKFASRELEHAQTRNIQTYIAYGGLIVGIILMAILLTYSFVINTLGGIG